MLYVAVLKSDVGDGIVSAISVTLYVPPEGGQYSFPCRDKQSQCHFLSASQQLLIKDSHMMSPLVLHKYCFIQSTPSHRPVWMFSSPSPTI